MRNPAVWIIGILVGIGVVLGATALAGSSDRRNEPVSAAEWADGVCGALGVWRGDLEAIADNFRSSGQIHADATREDRRGAVRVAYDQVLEATDVMIEGVKSAGVPDSPQGEQAADAVVEWAESASDDLEDARDTLDDAGGEPRDTLEALGQATAALTRTFADGVKTLRETVGADAQLGAALADNETCQALPQGGGR